MVHPSVAGLRLPAPWFTGLAEGHSGSNDQSDFCTQFMRKRPTEPDGRRPLTQPWVCVHCSRFAVCILTLRLFRDDSTALSHVHFAMRRIATAQITGHSDRGPTKTRRLTRTNVKRQGQCVHVTDSRSQKTIDVKMRDFVRPCSCDVNEDARLAAGACALDASD